MTAPEVTTISTHWALAAFDIRCPSFVLASSQHTLRQHLSSELALGMLRKKMSPFLKCGEYMMAALWGEVRGKRFGLALKEFITKLNHSHPPSPCPSTSDPQTLRHPLINPALASSRSLSPGHARCWWRKYIDTTWADNPGKACHLEPPLRPGGSLSRRSDALKWSDLLRGVPSGHLLYGACAFMLSVSLDMEERGDDGGHRRVYGPRSSLRSCQPLTLSPVPDILTT
ncbi:hypothetical protein C0Q70_13666 [Pomacea canaliculata]|uniref:Uncharacterized protein n=1 Tax=Pomacea canaliculata TaxID=400727 RepID=A0A2T7NXU2_POMCA|nr:hypothetical protein C0Q70_13666 [Pomacea canaliculata]